MKVKVSRFLEFGVTLWNETKLKYPKQSNDYSLSTVKVGRSGGFASCNLSQGKKSVPLITVDR